MDGCTGQRGQAMVEFAIVIALFVLLLLPILDAGIWALESDAAVSAVEQGVGIALAASGSADASRTSERLVYGQVAPALREAMLGTAVEDWWTVRERPMWANFPGCPQPNDVADREGVGHVVVCAINNGDRTVTVSVAGYARSGVPPAFGLGRWRTGGIAIAEEATAPVGTFTE